MHDDAFIYFSVLRIGNDAEDMEQNGDENSTI